MTWNVTGKRRFQVANCTVYRLSVRVLQRAEQRVEAEATETERELYRTIYGHKSRVMRLRTALAASGPIARQTVARKRVGIWSRIDSCLTKALQICFPRKATSICLPSKRSKTTTPAILLKVIKWILHTHLVTSIL